MANPALKRFPTVPQQVAHGTEGGGPGRGATRIKHEKSFPRERARAGQQRTNNTQSGDEPGDENGLVAMFREKRIELLEAGRSQPIHASITFEQPSSPSSADEEAEIVTENCRPDRRHDDPDDRQVAETRERGASQQDGLAGNRKASVFEKDAEKEDEIAVSGEKIGQPGRHECLATL